jgi:hypothetical protein
MVRFSDYWQMLQLTSAGQCRPREQPLAKRWFQSQWAEPWVEPSTSEPDLQTDLWQRWQAGTEDSLLARLCLRCWLSHQIAWVCRQLANQFGEAYGFTAADLWPLVLDDDGSLESAYKPLTVQILDKYDPTRSALSTWANRLTKGHPEINQFCLQQGLYRASDWAILNDTEVDQLPRALPHLSTPELTQASALLAAYHRVYRQARIALWQTGKGRPCAEPTPEQLTQMNPELSPQLVLSRLHALAEQLRTYRIAARRRTPLAQSLDSLTEQGVEPEALDEDPSVRAERQVEDEFKHQYEVFFRESLGEALQKVVQGYVNLYRQRQPRRDQAYLQALELFHCRGLAMGKIAQQVGLASQVQVTRLIQLRRLRSEVCAHWFNQLKQQVQDRALEHMAIDRFNNIVQQLDQILMEEITGVMEEAAAEAQMPRNRTTRSLLARRLCQLLAALGQP